MTQQHTESGGYIHIVKDTLDSMEIEGSFGTQRSILFEVKLLCDKIVVVSHRQLSYNPATCISCIQHLGI